MKFTAIVSAAGRAFIHKDDLTLLERAASNSVNLTDLDARLGLAFDKFKKTPRAALCWNGLRITQAGGNDLLVIFHPAP